VTRAPEWVKREEEGDIIVQDCANLNKCAHSTNTPRIMHSKIDSQYCPVFCLVSVEGIIAWMFSWILSAAQFCPMYDCANILECVNVCWIPQFPKFHFLLDFAICWIPRFPRFHWLFDFPISWISQFPARCVSHTLEECVGYHTLISNLVCGILYHTLFYSNSGKRVGHSKFECVGQLSDKT